MSKLELAIAITLLGGCAQDLSTSSTSQRVSLDPATGTGFVGKGAVQGAFHWNNAELQTNVAGLTFTMDVSATYAQSCLHATGSEHKTVEKTFQKTIDLSSAVAAAARRNPQDKVTGFLLTGIASGALTPPADLCNPGQSEPEDVWVPDPNGAYPTVTQTAGGDATLTVHFGTESHVLSLTDDGGDDAED